LQTTGGSLAMKDSFHPPMPSWFADFATPAPSFSQNPHGGMGFSPYETVSSVAGITRNPYDLEVVPAGSSGGTAAAVAANFGAVGLGTDTGNSIRGPSSHNALVGIRPTIGLTSRDGIIPLF